MSTEILGAADTVKHHAPVKHLDLVCKSLYLSRNRI
jgi:hypothetical protein